MKHVITYAAALLLTACASGAAQAGPKPAAGPTAGKPVLDQEEAWFEFAFLGRKVGYMLARDELTQINGQAAIHAHRWSVVTVRRERETVRMEFATDAYFTPDGTPMRFTQSRKEGAEARNLEGYRDGDVMVIRQDVGGNVETTRIPLEGVKLASSLDVLVTQHLEVGWKASGKALDEAEGSVQEYAMEVVKKTEREGKPVFEVRQVLGPLTTTLWVSPDGKVQASQTDPIKATLARTTRDKAVAMPDGTVDIFSSGMFAVPELPPGQELEQLTVRLSGRSGARPPFITGLGQKAKDEKKGSVVLVLTALDPPAKRVARASAGKKMKAFLQPTPYEPLSDERLKAVVARVVGDEPDAWAAARAINAFVHGHIQNKSLAKAFATAVEALESKEGDCTEHAVLFSALAKIAGIPTRLVTGLVYVGPGRKMFGYHEWVEVYLAGRWIPMDPTFGQDVADPTHIKFTEGQSDHDGLREAGLVAAQIIGDLKLDVLEYVTLTKERRKL
ncbi:MAG: transglutaminase domain-containing protein [Deltaproteobacteria bacterium]|nr:transglutaminase domain-containing protein [Deltaproteobacteria bacterium]